LQPAKEDGMTHVLALHTEYPDLLVPQPAEGLELVL